MRNLDERAAKQAGVALSVLARDVQDTASVTAAVDQLIASEGRIDVLINNAGAGFVRSTEQATMDEINWVMDVNYLGVVRCTKAVMPHMRAQRSGGITTEFDPSVLKHVTETGGMLDDEYLPILQKYIGGSTTRQGGSDIYQTPDEVAAVVLDCVHSDAPPIRTRTSDWSNEMTHLKTGLDPDGKRIQAQVIKEFLS